MRERGERTRGERRVLIVAKKMKLELSSRNGGLWARGSLCSKSPLVSVTNVSDEEGAGGSNIFSSTLSGDKQQQSLANNSNSKDRSRSYASVSSSKSRCGRAERSRAADDVRPLRTKVDGAHGDISPAAPGIERHGPSRALPMSFWFREESRRR